MNDTEHIERLRQAIMRYRELITLLHATVDKGERAYEELFADYSATQREAAKEKDLQWQIAARLLSSCDEAGANAELRAFQNAALAMRIEARNFERDFEQVYDILAEL
jgi:hypothetical protein